VPAGQAVPCYLEGARTVLVTNPYFVLERVELSAKSTWELNAEHETWLLVVDGYAQIGLLNKFVGEATYLDAESVRIKVGAGGLTCLVAYLASEPDTKLLQARFPIHHFSQPSLHQGVRVATPIR
jgi:mannose-6-phosphate isomerase